MKKNLSSNSEQNISAHLFCETGEQAFVRLLLCDTLNMVNVYQLLTVIISRRSDFSA